VIARLPEMNSRAQVSIPRLILLPGGITLAVTLLRLVGELLHWSKTWFNPEQGGFLAVVGIVWLAPIFGIYFALKLSGAGQGTEHLGHAIAHAILGAILLGTGFYLLNGGVIPGLQGVVVMWALAALGAVLQWRTWRSLFKVLLAYGYAARIPVAMVMALATWAGWQSHYSAAVPGEPKLEMYFLAAVIPQLVWWVAFTIVTGSLFGTLATLMVRGRQPATQTVG
jgi:hypothetical protein